MRLAVKSTNTLLSQVQFFQLGQDRREFTINSLAKLPKGEEEIVTHKVKTKLKLGENPQGRTLQPQQPSTRAPTSSTKMKNY